MASIFDCQEYEDLQIVKHQAIPLLLLVQEFKFKDVQGVAVSGESHSIDKPMIQ